LTRTFTRYAHPIETEDYDEPSDRVEVPESEATLISSKIPGTDDEHGPVFDLDFPARLVPSSTEGHFHLYLERPISWRKFRLVLWAMWKAGLIEKGYYRNTVRRGAAYVRVPGVPKGHPLHLAPPKDAAA
jgi:hypothetical protein